MESTPLFTLSCSGFGAEARNHLSVFIPLAGIELDALIKSHKVVIESCLCPLRGSGIGAPRGPKSKRAYDRAIRWTKIPTGNVGHRSNCPTLWGVLLLGTLLRKKSDEYLFSKLYTCGL